MTPTIPDGAVTSPAVPSPSVTSPAAPPPSVTSPAAPYPSATSPEAPHPSVISTAAPSPSATSPEAVPQEQRSGETPVSSGAQPALSSAPALDESQAEVAPLPKSPITTSLPEGLTFRLLHVGVAVPALDPAADLLGTLLGYRVVSGPFDDPIQKVSVNFLTQADDNVAEIELIAPLTPDSPITSTLKKSGGGAYHLCFETNDLERALAHVTAHRCIVISPPNPAVAFAGRRIAWFYTPNRQLIELVEANPPINS